MLRLRERGGEVEHQVEALVRIFRETALRGLIDHSGGRPGTRDDASGGSSRMMRDDQIAGCRDPSNGGRPVSIVIITHAIE